MKLIRIKFNGEKMGTVQTVVHSDRRTRQLTSFTGDELAQLAVDVWTLPQILASSRQPIDGNPSLRPGEDVNLLKLIFNLGRQRYGMTFNRVVAKRYMASIPS